MAVRATGWPAEGEGPAGLLDMAFIGPQQPPDTERWKGSEMPREVVRHPAVPDGAHHAVGEDAHPDPGSSRRDRP